MSKASRPAGIRIAVRRFEHGEGLPLPAYQSEGAAGLDLVAAVGEDKPLRLKPRQRALVPTGLAIELPAGYEGQVRPRSGLAHRHGLTVLNAPGTIDADYRGEVQVLLINLGDAAITVRRGDRIAQLVIAPVMQARLTITVALEPTRRGAGGFGSTGKAAAPGKRRPAKAAEPEAVKKSAKVAPATAGGKRRSTTAGGSAAARRQRR